jgi:perosamine synthetase
MNVPLSKPDIGQREIDYVSEVLKSGQLSLGPKVKEFEDRFASYTRTRFAVATSSGTSALHLAIRALGIGPGDEVVTTSFSFVASANCIQYEGAVPVFVDIDPSTLNISAEHVRRFFEQCCLREGGYLVNRLTGRRVKAVLPVHVFGLPCDMGAILGLASEYGLHVIEDACEALGATYRGRRVGSFGDVACFAFYPNKQITTGEGGMIVTNDESIACLCRSMRNQGRDEESAWLRHVRLGYNYRLSDLHCALGLAQLERVDELLSRRRAVAAVYDSALAAHPLLRVPPHFEGLTRSWFVYVVRLLGCEGGLRDRVMLRLRSLGIGCQAYFPAIHRQPYFRDAAVTPLGRLVASELASDSCLALPFFSSITTSDVCAVAETLKQILNEEAVSRAGQESVASANA